MVDGSESVRANAESMFKQKKEDLQSLIDQAMSLSDTKTAIEIGKCFATIEKKYQEIINLSDPEAFAAAMQSYLDKQFQAAAGASVDMQEVINNPSFLFSLGSKLDDIARDKLKKMAELAQRLKPKL